ncbi:MAG: hypothetical protein ACK6BG_13100 [Cyanobacteriota bacterium]|jgi:hypothetical protein
MILLSIDNASEVMAQKLGKFLESLTPDSFDQTTIEDVVIRKLIENLSAEGMTGQVAAVRGLELGNKTLHISEQMHVRHQDSF